LLAETIRRTWASVDIPNVETLFYYGDAPRLLVRGRNVFLPAGDGLEATGEKTLSFFEFALRHLAFDVLFRTNLSSYVDLPNLRSFTELHARQPRYYAGFTGTHEGVPFAAGAGYFLSRDLVELALSERPRWNHAVLDDVALAEALARHGVRPAPVPRRDYGSLAELDAVDTTLFHFRCKTATSPLRLEDVRIIMALHRAFLSARGQRPAPSLLGLQLLALIAERSLSRASLLRVLR
jgi:hypothetical protein